MIRQAISCDICGNEKRQTNHWFVAYEQSGELRVSGWSSRNRLRPGTKHLCGQTCLHKLVDDFMARAIGQKSQCAPQSERESDSSKTDASLTSRAAYDGFESSARLITPVAVASAMPATIRSNVVIALPEEPRYASRNWRAEAWEREREREMRQECRTDLMRRRAGDR